MDVDFFQKVKQSYAYQVSEPKMSSNVMKELDKKLDVARISLNDQQVMKEEVLKEIGNTEAQLKEVEQLYLAQTSIVNDLKKKIEEKKLEVKKLDHLKQQYLFRKDKAKAKLSQKDVDFINSLEKRLIAFKHMTGVIWDYPNCSEDYVRGYIRNIVSNKIKYFEGNLEPDEIWQLIEKMNRK